MRSVLCNTWLACFAGLALAPGAAFADDWAAISIRGPAEARSGAPAEGLVAVLEASAVAQVRYTIFLTPSGAIADAIGSVSGGPVALNVGRQAVRLPDALPMAPPGRYRYAIVVSREGGDDNALNDGAVSEATVVLRAARANLAVAEQTLETVARRAGEPIALDYQLVNTGSAAATFRAVWVLDSSSTLGPNSRVLGEARVSLAARARSAGRFTASAPSWPAGHYRTGLVLDPEQAVDESNEIDNVVLAAADLVIFEDTLRLPAQTLPEGTVFVPFFAALGAEGGDGRYAFTLSRGALPTGLALDPARGAIAGTPLASGRFDFSVAATSRETNASADYTLVVARSEVPLAITTPSLGRAVLNRPYRAALSAIGGEPPYTFRVGARLPDGITLSEAGALTGTPVEIGEFALPFAVTDAFGTTSTQSLVLPIDAPSVQVVSSTLSPARLFEEVSWQLDASGGIAPYRWSALSSLPPGLELTAAGSLTGRPARVGRFSVRVAATDASNRGATDDALILFEVQPAGEFEFPSRALPPAVRGVEYVYALSPKGGTPPLRFRVVPGDTLPSGFRLVPSTEAKDCQVLFTGRSPRALTGAFRVEVEDAAGRTLEALLTLEVQEVGAAGGAGDGGCRCLQPAGTAPGASAAAVVIGLLLILARGFRMRSGSRSEG